MTVTIRLPTKIPMPKLADVQPLEGFRVRIAWAYGQRAGKIETIDLAPMISTLKFYKPLRGDRQLFQSIHPVLGGSAIAWGNQDEIDMAATSLERLAEETMSPDDLRAFLSNNGLTHAQAAAELGYGRRRLEYFLSGKPIPRVFVLACYGYVARKQRAGRSLLLYAGTQIADEQSLTSTKPSRVLPAA